MILIGRTSNDNKALDAEVFVLSKYLKKFLKVSRFAIDCEIDLSWSKECIITEISITPAVAENLSVNLPVQAREAIQITEATFQINNAKLYVPLVTLSINDNIKFLENIKQGIKRVISWNKYWSQVTII